MNKEKKIELFKKYVNKYVDFFGLLEYKIEFEENTEDSTRAACYWYNMNDMKSGSGMCMNVTYNKEWIENASLTEEEIKQTAFHEVMEILLSKIRDFANTRDYYVSNYQVDEEIHKIIRRFENRILKLIKD